MAVSLLVSSFAAAALLFRITPSRNANWRLAIMQSALWHGLLIVVWTELLSYDRALTATTVTMLWGWLAGIHAVLLGYRLRQRKARSAIVLRQAVKQLAVTPHHSQSALAIERIIIPVVIMSTIGLCLLRGWLEPPYNYDAMTYHLPRVMHWIQNHTVAHYPTHNLRQISFAPGAAYLLTHLHLLTGGDYGDNCIQGLAFVVCILGTSLIAPSDQKHSQVLTALVCASVPMAIMQASTCQTDLLVSCWLVCAAYFVLKPEQSLPDWWWLAVAIGLAIVTKPTGIIFGLPLLMVQAWRLLMQSRQLCLRTLLHSLFLPAIVLLAALSLSLPSYGRNLQTFGTPLGTTAGTTNTLVSFPAILSTILRNLALSLPFPPLWQWIQAIHQQFLGLDVNHPNITYGDNRFDIDNLWWRILLPEDENFVGNPVHLLLIGVAVGMLVMT
ncbi:MAG: glycosyltransferase family 39 protein, partial [Cyanobacteria bacterium]|nr:glycosyltransferase family 39 protein [Cyanobacteriota bacterium]MDW8200777.1 glycosyltransferase family 39 protein [Cyanobacteriota bacterium SKYGB_h_bin112]